jgi:hypothetical protein
VPARQYLRQAFVRPYLAALPLVAAAVALHYTWAAPNLWILFVQFALCGLVYAAGVWAIGVTAEDRRKVLAGGMAVGRRLGLVRPGASGPRGNA